MTQDTALLVIDAQVNMFDESFPIYQGKQLLENLKALIIKAREQDIPIVYIQNNGRRGDPDEPGTTGWEIHPILAPVEGDIVAQKDESSGFNKTKLHQQLQAKGIKKLIIMGMQSDVCIQTNCRNAYDLKYNVVLVGDVHSTFDSETAKAPEIIERINRDLSEIITIEKASRIDFVTR